MKKLFITTIALFATALSFAQDSHPTEFKFIPPTNDTPTSVAGKFSRLNTDYVVLESNGTADENYQKVLNFIKTSYKNPEEVIVAESENKFVKISGAASNLTAMINFGITTSFDIRYNMTFYVKDDKIKIDLSSIEQYLPASQFSSGGWAPFNGMATHKNNNKMKLGLVPYVNAFQNYFNGLAKGAATFELSSVVSNDKW